MRGGKERLAAGGFGESLQQLRCSVRALPLVFEVADRVDGDVGRLEQVDAALPRFIALRVSPPSV